MKRFHKISSVMLAFTFATVMVFPQDASTDPNAKAKPDAQSGSPGTQSAKPDAKSDAKNKNLATAEDEKKIEAADEGGHGHFGGCNNDVDAIGNRSVGNRGMGNWYSIEREVAMGKQYSAQVESTVKLVQDPVVTEYVNRIGQNLVRNSDAKVPFTIKVVDSDEINAFALPGGYFYVNSGLILAADDESELAGVMAHEIAHVAARHQMRQQTRLNWADILSVPLIFVGGGIGYAARQAAGLALPITFMKFSRGFESEADCLGVQYMYKTGYDPNSFVSFFEKVQALEKKKPGALAKAFASHPQTPDRIEKTQTEIATILPAREQYVVTTSEFDDVKSRLAAIENKRKIDDKDKDRPSLRRTSANDRASGSGDANKGDSSKGDSSKDDEDRPKLQRRD